MLPQVLGGLGLLSLVNTSCFLFLQRLQPLFVTVALGFLAYQGWLIKRRPAGLRDRKMKIVLGLSLGINVVLIGAWIALWIRYW